MIGFLDKMGITMSKRELALTLLIVFAVIIATCVFTVYFLPLHSWGEYSRRDEPMYGPQPQYWRGPSVAEPWDVAPDGWYHIQSGWATENNYTQFPLCPSSGTQLHGVWKSDVFIPDNFNGNVRVQNQTIVEIGE